MAIIGISGKKQSGKDTVGSIIQYLIWKHKVETMEIGLSTVSLEDFFKMNQDSKRILSGWEIKKFADKLKDIVCILIGCTREQLEDEGFKNTILREEWWYYKILTVGEETKYILYPYLENIHNCQWHPSTLIKLTPRKLLQLLGTECGRQIIHPNIWVNALMVDYKPINQSAPGRFTVNYPPEVDFIHNQDYDGDIKRYLIYPNWIITDVRFPNEVEAIKRKGGIIIRVNRFSWVKEQEKQILKEVWNYKVEEHESEVALDNYKDFHYVIENKGTIEELVEKISNILKKENLI